MNNKQMNKFLEIRAIPDEVRYIAIDPDGAVYGYNEEPTYNIDEYYSRSQFYFLGTTTRPTHPELEIYIYE